VRDIRAWREAITADLRQAWIPPEDQGAAGQLLHIELALYLAETSAPRHPFADAWALLGGYPFLEATGSGASDAQQQRIAVARHLLLRFKDRYDWHAALRAYREMPETLRGYDIDPDAGTARRRMPMVLPGRWGHYEQALGAAPPDRRSPVQAAVRGRYLVRTTTGQSGVDIPNWLPLPAAAPGHDLTARRDRNGIRVSLCALRAVAEEADAAEERMGWSPRSNWVRRLDGLTLEIRAVDDRFEPSDELVIDGILHLIGMVSAGKSTLVDLLTMWAAGQGMRVCVVADNVTAVLRKVTHLTALGVSAAPVLGQSTRVRHVNRLHQLTAADSGGLGGLDEPAFSQVSTACALDGLRDSDGAPWEVDRAPCRRLIPLDAVREDGSVPGSRYRGCPVWHRCQRYAPSRDLVGADVWVATTASLIHTEVPREINGERLRYLEAAWRRSDLIIADEADRVQAQLDEMFSPAQPLVGPDFEAWLDEIVAKTHDWNRRTERERMADPGVRRWTAMVNNAKAAADTLYALLSRDRARPQPVLKEWIDTDYFTAWTLSQQLAQAWAGYSTPGGRMPSEGWEEDPRYRILRSSFNTFIDDPLGQSPPADQLASGLVRLASELLRDTDENARLGRVRTWLEDAQKQSADDGNQLVIDDLTRQAARLEVTVALAVLADQLDKLIENCRGIELEMGLDGAGSVLFHRVPRDYQPVVPESPMGNVLGFQYLENDPLPGRSRGPMGHLRFFRCSGIGRWVLLHLHDLFRADSDHGPSVLLLSGTSWAGTSPRYHLGVPVTGVLRPRSEEIEAIRASRFEFLPLFTGDTATPLRVSGKHGDARARALQRVIAALADPGLGKSLLERHRDGLPPGRRRVLLLVGSYPEAKAVAAHLVALRGSWKDQVRYLVPDHEEFTDSWDGSAFLRRGDLSTFADTGAWILVAPLLAVERGHNILNDDEVAAIGAAYFLIRPHPRPDDLSYVTQRVNQWACQQIADNLPAVGREHRHTIGDCATIFRRAAHRRWRTLLHQHWAYSTLPDDDHDERRALVWTQLVTIWQVIGRLVRGGVPAQVFFCDAAFAPYTALRADTDRDIARTSLLLGLREVLAPYFEPTCHDPDRHLVDALYGCLYEALNQIEGM
jgi:hypothetical protein